jgi:hypothetical protein
LSGPPSSPECGVAVAHHWRSTQRRGREVAEDRHRQDRRTRNHGFGVRCGRTPMASPALWADECQVLVSRSGFRHVLRRDGWHTTSIVARDRYCPVTAIMSSRTWETTCSWHAETCIRASDHVVSEDKPEAAESLPTVRRYGRRGKSDSSPGVLTCSCGGRPWQPCAGSCAPALAGASSGTSLNRCLWRSVAWPQPLPCPRPP